MWTSAAHALPLGLRWAEGCAAVWAAVTWRMGWQRGTARALGVAAGPGPCATSGAWREPQRPRRRRRRQHHNHAAVASRGVSAAQPLLPRSLGIARAAAVGPAAAGGRLLRCVATHAAPPWITARDPLTSSCLVVRRCRCSRSAARCAFAPAAARLPPRAPGACCRGLRCVDKTAAFKQRPPRRRHD